MKVLTLQQLKEKNACSEQVELFKAMFGESVIITESLCLSVADKFVWNWASDNLLDERQRKLYNESITPAWKLFNESRSAALKLYNESISAALKLYNESMAPAEKLYDESMAPAFANAYNSQGSK